METGLIVKPENMMVAKNISEIIETNLGGQFDLTQLDRVKMPSGGSTQWALPSLDGDLMVPEISGVIVYVSYQNAYWSQSVDETGGGTPPDCAARDGRLGVGGPGGACSSCPLNQFGSDGKGKACKNMALVFILQEGSILPVAVALAPTSLKPLRKYLLQVTQSGAAYYHVVTRLGLDRTKNDKGIAYSVVKLTAATLASGGKRLPDEVIANIEKYRHAIIPALQSVQVEQGDTAE